MLLLAVALWFGSTGAAHAYLDPGTGSILLQAIIGGVASGLFITRIYWRKIKSFLGGGQGDDGPQSKARHSK
jgi:uncharacterized membrane-anchored protein YitT (DUF2179 family)